MKERLKDLKTILGTMLRTMDSPPQREQFRVWDI
jgi:hypothetical protein